MRSLASRLTRTALGIAVVGFLASVPAVGQLRGRPLAPLPRGPSGPATPAHGEVPATALVIGALLPLSGPGAWYGKEIRQGMELAAAVLAPSAPKEAATAAGSGGDKQKARGSSEAKGASDAPPSGGATAGTETKTSPESKAPTHTTAPDDTKATSGKDAAPGAATVRVTFDFVDVEPLDTKAAERAFAKVVGGGASVVFTASPTPTAAIYSLAAARDVLVFHLGWPSGSQLGPRSDRVPPGNRTIFQLRPTPAARAEALAAYAWEHGVRRLAILGGGDDFGKAVRSTLSQRWRALGSPPVVEESLNAEAGDLHARLVRIARQAPDAVSLAYRGVELGTVATALREAGYTGLLLALDDDRAALLAAGDDLRDMVILSDAFVPVPDSHGERFAKVYQERHAQAPSRFAATAFDAVYALAVAWSAPEGRPGPGGSRLRAALLGKPAYPSVFGGELTVKDDGAVEHPLAAFGVTAGKAKFVGYVKVTR